MAVDYQGFARNVLAATQPAPDRTIPNMLLARQINAQDEDRTLRREENMLNRGLRERQLGIAEATSQRAVEKDSREAAMQQLDLTERLLTGLGNVPEAQRASVYPRFLEHAKAGGIDVSSLTGDYMQDAPKLAEYAALVKQTKDRALQTVTTEEGVFAFNPADGTLGQRLGGRPVTPGTTVNVGQSEHGTIPPGYQLVRDANGNLSMAPIPGGPVAKEDAGVQAAGAAREEQKERQTDLVIQDIGRVFDLMEGATLPTTGGTGGLLSNVPGTAARDVAGLLDTIKANVGFDKLQAMRDASPTGGALGQVSERENSLLQATMGNLEQSQSQEQFDFNLRRLNNILLDIVHGANNGPPRMPLTGPRSSAAPDPAAAALKQKYGLE